MANLTLTLAQARKLALKAQGFGSSRRANTDPGWRQLKRHLQQMRILQIDAINTVIRSHYTPLYSRLGTYDRTLLNHHVFRPRRVPGDRAFFEYWGHECSVLPVELYPLLRWRMDDAREGLGVYRQLKQLVIAKPDFVANILEQVRQKPMTCRDISVDQRGPGMWEWSESKQALEYLFWTGELASVGRRNFERVYGAPESVIPAQLLQESPPDRTDAQARLLELAAAALGVATAADLRDYFRLSAADGAKALDRLVQQQRLIEVAVREWNKPAYMLPDTVIPRKLEVATLLSPFDPVVWFRLRAKRLFAFDYRIEIYVPEPKRQFGYWVMPFLLDDKIVARLDLKADRENNVFRIKGAWSEASVDRNQVATMVRPELERMAAWLNLDRLEFTAQGDLGARLFKQGA